MSLLCQRARTNGGKYYLPIGICKVNFIYVQLAVHCQPDFKEAVGIKISRYLDIYPTFNTLFDIPCLSLSKEYWKEENLILLTRIISFSNKICGYFALERNRKEGLFGRVNLSFIIVPWFWIMKHDMATFLFPFSKLPPHPSFFNSTFFIKINFDSKIWFAQIPKMKIIG